MLSGFDSSAYSQQSQGLESYETWGEQRVMEDMGPERGDTTYLGTSIMGDVCQRTIFSCVGKVDS